MDAEALYLRLREIALTEFPDLVFSISLVKGPLNTPKSLRIFFRDNSFLEIWLSEEKYSYHWQRQHDIYRYDNAPHPKHKHLKTFPHHFHDGSEENVKESYLNKNPEKAIREFLQYVREHIPLKKE